MLVVRDPEELIRVTSQEMRSIIARRIAALSEDEPYDPAVFGHFVIVEEGDTLAALDQELRFSVLENRFDGTRFGEPNFTPSFELVERHSSCYEMVFVLSDDGYGVEVFVPKSSGVEPRLLACCEQYAVTAQEGMP